MLMGVAYRDGWGLYGWWVWLTGMDGVYMDGGCGVFR